MDLRVFLATEKELHEPCAVRSDQVLAGQWVVTCSRCLTLSHVDCWNERERCPTVGCTSRGRATAAVTALAKRGCPYCGETLASSDLAQCPHCKEYLNQVLLRQSLELERYKRCPRGLKGLALWYRFNSVIMWLLAFSTLVPHPNPPWMVTVMLAVFAAGFWKLGTGIRYGRSWARTAGYVMSLLYIFSLNGLVIGIICMSTLSSQESQVYFQPEQGDAT